MKVRALKAEHIGGVFRRIGEIFNLRPHRDAEDLERRGLIKIVGRPRQDTSSLTKKEKPTVLVEPPDLWIVIPTHNRKDELKRQLKDLAKRRFTRVVVVNDGSTDGTEGALIDAEKLYEWLRVINLAKNSGVAFARRIGTGLVSDDATVVELDDHDELHEGALEGIQDSFRDPDVHFVYGDCRIVDEAGKVDHAPRKPDYRPGLFREDCYALGVRAYRKKLYNDVGGYRLDEFPAEDYALFLRMELYLNDKGFKRIPASTGSGQAEPLCTVKMTGAGVSVRLSPELAANAEKYRAWAIRRAEEQDAGEPLNLDFGYPAEPRNRRIVEPRDCGIDIVMPVSDKKELTLRCIDSILRYTRQPQFIFIADEALSFRDELRRHGTLILTRGDFNFARAVNLGIKAAGESDVVVLNNDIEVKEGWLDKLTSTPFGASMARTDFRCCGNRDAWGRGPVQRTRGVLNMFCVYLPRKVIKMVGLLDERFCYYGGEDTDYSLRCMRHRIPLWISSAFVKHKTSSSYGDAGPLMQKGMAIFEKKWGCTHTEINRHYDNSLVSVVIIGRNCGGFAEECIRSIKEQTYKNLEIIIFDDASTDGTAEICRDLKDERIIFIQNPAEAGRRGGPANRTTGMNMARGEFIAFQDMDDYSARDRIEKLLTTVSETPDIDLLYSDLQLIKEGGQHQSSDWHTGAFDRVRLLGDNSFWIAAGTFLFRKHLARHVGAFPAEFEALIDVIWLLLADERGVKMRYIDEKLYCYRMHGGNIAGGKASKRAFRHLQEMERLRGEYENTL